MSNPAERLHPRLQHHILNTYGWTDLRAVQKLAIGPVLDGGNTVILAPTAGGKTEAAFFPLVSRMITEDWQGLSILYLSPIKALLNNQFERLEKLMALVGYTVGIWHGDVAASQKNRMRREPPHVLLTTPESLEGMLISTRTAPGQLFANLRAVVIDEVHAFAGDDRGWHLLGVLQRLSAYAGRDVQRLGLSATVGNPGEIAAWLGRGSQRAKTTVDPPNAQPRAPEVTIDWVANLSNAAKIIAKLHPAERRLVFCDSRIQCEKLARELRAREVTVHVSHSSLSADERRQTERAFAEGGPGVIVATSALELGIDIGSLDRVIQIDAPYSVASFLQRMGRTGRRAGTTANMLFLTLSDPGLVRAAAIVDMWKNGEVEPARAPGAPHHILAQQVMALVLERPGLSVGELGEALRPFRQAADISAEDTGALLNFLVGAGYLFLDGARLGIGRTGEEELGRRNFLNLVSVFTSAPVFKVMANRREIGEVHQSTFLNEDDEDGGETGPRARRPMVLLLAGRSWRVTGINWSRRVAHVEPFDMPGKTRWLSLGQPMSAMLARAHQRVLTGSTLGAAHWSRRASQALEGLLMSYQFLAHAVGAQPCATLLYTTELAGPGGAELWNFAGAHANHYLAACLKALGIEVASTNALRLKFAHPPTLDALQKAVRHAASGTLHPPIAPNHPMVRGLKFRELLPDQLLQDAARARIYGEAPWRHLDDSIVVFDAR